MTSRLFGVWLHAKRGQTQVHRCLCYSRCSMRGSLHDRGGRAGWLAGKARPAAARAEAETAADGPWRPMGARGAWPRGCACSDMEGVCCKIGPLPALRRPRANSPVDPA